MAHAKVKIYDGNYEVSAYLKTSDFKEWNGIFKQKWRIRGQEAIRYDFKGQVKETFRRLWGELLEALRLLYGRQLQVR